MKSKTFSMIAAFSLVIVAGVASAYGQDQQVKADIPFAFAVGSSTLPAGEYNFSRLSPNVWEIRTEDGSRSILTLARYDGNNTEEDSAKVVFKHCGEHYFLSEVRFLGENIAIPQSKAERTLEREMARNGSPSQTVSLVASIR